MISNLINIQLKDTPVYAFNKIGVYHEETMIQKPSQIIKYCQDIL